MKNFIIVDTWNGEGYSDSKAEIKQFKNELEAAKYCFEAAFEQAELFEINVFPHTDDDGKITAYCYVDSFDVEDQNAGAFHFEEITHPIKGITINPLVNEYFVFETQEEWDEAVKLALDEGDYDEAEKEVLKSNHVNGIYIHMGMAGEGDAAFFQFDFANVTEDELEFEEVGNTIDTEVWIDEEGNRFQVPVEIVRDFTNAIKL